ncbi:MAG: ferredoxin, partial [Mariniphaga sp.]|nr:ferredoxin [Mariniphaga sp.]
DKCMECGACEINCITDALSVKQGVGCATAVIFGWFKGGDPDCGSGCDGPDATPTCCN